MGKTIGNVGKQKLLIARVVIIFYRFINHHLFDAFSKQLFILNSFRCRLFIGKTKKAKWLASENGETQEK